MGLPLGNRLQSVGRGTKWRTVHAHWREESSSETRTTTRILVLQKPEGTEVPAVALSSLCSEPALLGSVGAADLTLDIGQLSVTGSKTE